MSVETRQQPSPETQAQHPNEIDTLDFEFHGSGMEYFRIWIVNIFLSIITLGIFSAWAKVRKEQYFYGNLRLGEQYFSYLADPLKILKGRIIAFGLLAAYWACFNFIPITAMGLLVIGVLALPAILVASSRFKMRNSAYRNIRFQFTASFGDTYRTFITPLIVILILSAVAYWLLYQVDPDTLTAWGASGQTEELPEDFRMTPEDFLLTTFYLVILPFLPYLDYLRVKLLVSHTRWGNQQATFNAGVGEFYGVFFVGLIITVAITTITALVVFGGGAVFSAVLGDTVTRIMVSVVLVYISMIYASGYWRAERTNLIYGNTRVGDTRIGSALTFGQVGEIYVTNTLAILFSAGLLIPWAQVRMARYIASMTSMTGAHIDDVIAENEVQQSAFGEGIVDAFDLDIGL